MFSFVILRVDGSAVAFASSALNASMSGIGSTLQGSSPAVQQADCTIGMSLTKVVCSLDFIIPDLLVSPLAKTK